jgi:glycosyltransferase involved in cell wall biosynthesis
VAQFPYFVVGPNTLLSLVGLIRGRDTTPPTPARDWRTVTVDVVIPAFNEQANIVRCLASLQRQTLAPRRIVVVDDGSRDLTAGLAWKFRDQSGLDIRVITRRDSIGKTPSIKQQVRTLDSDVLFVLDADTILQSDDYIERTVQELYQGVGIAAASGSILPLREKDRRAAEESAEVQAFAAATPSYRPERPRSWVRRLASAITNTYREVLYLFLQRVIFRGHMAAFGTVANPAGCAVAYRRAYLDALFDEVEPRLGDDLTNSEDIFIGLAMLDQGYRNVQVTDVCARTVEPEIQRVPKQLYLWSSAFLQSAFYFNRLLLSPFKSLKRRVRREAIAVRSAGIAYATAGATAPPNAMLSIAMTVENVAKASWQPDERRLVSEPYRQAFGREHTRHYGRPAGWMLFTSALEKVGFPSAILIMAMLGNRDGLLMTIGVETLLSVAAVMAVMKGRRLEYLVKGIAITPVRYALLVFELVTLARFATDMWLTGNRRWRK